MDLENSSHRSTDLVFKRGESEPAFEGWTWNQRLCCFKCINWHFGTWKKDWRIKAILIILEIEASNCQASKLSRFGTSNLTALKLLTQELEMTKQIGVLKCRCRRFNRNKWKSYIETIWLYIYMYILYIICTLYMSLFRHVRNSLLEA